MPPFSGLPAPPGHAPSFASGIGNPVAGQDPRRSLFVGNLSPFLSEGLFFHIFAACGPVTACRIIRDKPYGSNVAAGGLDASPRFGFIDYADHATAAHALQVMNGRSVFGLVVLTKWATGSTLGTGGGGGLGGAGAGLGPETFQIYVGNLSSDVDDNSLFRAFSAFRSIAEARIVRDSEGASKCYGFVSFRSQQDADQALVQMNGEWLGKRPMRINAAHNARGDEDNERFISNQTDPRNTTVYIGGVTGNTPEEVVRRALEECGRITLIRVHDGFAFVEFKAHDEAVKCIATKNGCLIGNKTVKIGWSRMRGGAGPSGGGGAGPSGGGGVGY